MKRQKTDDKYDADQMIIGEYQQKAENENQNKSKINQLGQAIEKKVTQKQDDQLRLEVKM